MGIVQGLTEFLPVSSSGHLIVVPFLAGWNDPFIRSLAFSVMLHLGTLLALLVYFRAEWLRLVPAGIATIRDRSMQGDPDRRLAWLLLAFDHPGGHRRRRPERPHRDVIPSASSWWRSCSSSVAVMLVARRPVRRQVALDRGRHVPDGLGIGVAQAIALVPGISRSGHLDRGGPVRRPGPRSRRPGSRSSWRPRSPPAPVLFEVRKLIVGEGGVDRLDRRRSSRARRGLPSRAWWRSISCSPSCAANRSTSSCSIGSSLAAVVDRLADALSMRPRGSHEAAAPAGDP